MAEKFHGVVVYEIIINANTVILNGIYSNTGNGGLRDHEYEVNNEIAKKKHNSEASDSTDLLVGEYDLRYIDTSLVNGTLKISIHNEAYYLEWFKLKQTSPIFTGIGLMAGKNHLAVSYLE